MNISYHTIGCKLNWAETEELRNELEKLGTTTVPFLTDEKITIIRACGVTCNASQATRDYIRRAKKMGKIVIALGCLEDSKLPEIDYALPTNESAIETIMNIAESEPIQKNTKSKNIINRTRAFLKIQTGCNFSCAYCIIPHFRGRATSISAKKIIQKIKELEREQYKEVTLTGVNICLYRDNKTDLAGLLKKILKETKIQRIRLGSLDPRLISTNLIRLYPNNRLMPHWHLSLQSGSDTVLQRMHRGYTTEQYATIIEKIKKRYALFSFTTDIIVGFPGETEKEFLETDNFVKEIKFSRVHIFPFSPRPNTDAYRMKNIVQDKIKKERCAKLKNKANKVAKKYSSNFIGQTQPVLFENKHGNIWEGYTPEYLRVIEKTNKNLHNKIVKIKLNEKNLK